MLISTLDGPNVRDNALGKLGLGSVWLYFLCKSAVLFVSLASLEILLLIVCYDKLELYKFKGLVEMSRRFCFGSLWFGVQFDSKMSYVELNSRICGVWGLPYRTRTL